MTRKTAAEIAKSVSQTAAETLAESAEPLAIVPGDAAPLAIFDGEHARAEYLAADTLAVTGGTLAGIAAMVAWRTVAATAKVTASAPVHCGQRVSLSALSEALYGHKGNTERKRMARHLETLAPYALSVSDVADVWERLSAVMGQPSTSRTLAETLSETLRPYKVAAEIAAAESARLATVDEALAESAELDKQADEARERAAEIARIVADGGDPAKVAAERAACEIAAQRVAEIRSALVTFGRFLTESAHPDMLSPLAAIAETLGQVADGIPVGETRESGDAGPTARERLARLLVSLSDISTPETRAAERESAKSAE